MSRPRPWLVIARREFIERVKTKWFVIATVLGPIGMLALIVIPAVLARTGADDVRIKIVDRSGELAAPIVAVLSAGQGWRLEAIGETPDRVLLDEIRADKIDGFITIPADALAGGAIIYRGDNATNQKVVIALHKTISAAVIGVRATRAGVTDAQLGDVMKPVTIETRHTTGDDEGTSGFTAFIIGYAVMFLLYMGILLYAMNVMRSVVQEKTSRVVELMVAAAKPRALMAGKILGVGAVGLFQMSIWLGMAFLTIEYREQVLGVFGVDGTGGFAIPPLRVTEVLVALAYFLFGYFFYAALYAAVGAMVSSEQEAQQAQLPVVLLLVIPMVGMQLVANDPRGGAAEVMTMLPFSSPILMPMRYLLGGASGLQLVLSLAILVASTAAVVVIAARIYRVGILMYGKRPSLRELVRWLRY